MNNIESLKKKLYAKDKIIAAFKQYDNERKRFYSNALIRLGQLESEMDEFRNTSKYKWKQKIRQLQNQVNLLQAALNIKDTNWDSNMTLDKAKVRITMLEDYVKKLELQNKKLKETNAQLILKLNENS